VEQKKKTQTQWSNEYNAKAYDRIALSVKKGRREKIRAHAAANGESVNGYINRLIAADMGIEDETEGNE